MVSLRPICKAIKYFANKGECLRLPAKSFKNVREVVYHQGLNGNITKVVKRSDGKEFVGLFTSKGELLSVSNGLFNPTISYRFVNNGNTKIINQHKVDFWNGNPLIGNKIINAGKTLVNTLVKIVG